MRKDMSLSSTRPANVSTKWAKHRHIAERGLVLQGEPQALNANWHHATSNKTLRSCGAFG
jgi:hypothetical protein